MQHGVEPDPDLKRRVGWRIAELRELRGLGGGELAQALRVTSRYLQRVEAGGENLTLTSLDKFAKALGTDIPDLLVTPTKTERTVGRPPGRIERQPRRRVSRARGRR